MVGKTDFLQVVKIPDPKKWNIGHFEVSFLNVQFFYRVKVVFSFHWFYEKTS